MTRRTPGWVAPLLLLAACYPRITPAVTHPQGEVRPAEADQLIAEARAAAGGQAASPTDQNELDRATNRALRGAALADQLLREGDELAAAGRFDAALDRYDRADLVRPNHAETTLRIATALDKQLRPVQAALQYRRFIHQMELERIRAEGEAAANIAAAITRAQERIIVLERRR